MDKLIELDQRIDKLVQTAETAQSLAEGWREVYYDSEKTFRDYLDTIATRLEVATQEKSWEDIEDLTRKIREIAHTVAADILVREVLEDETLRTNK